MEDVVVIHCGGNNAGRGQIEQHIVDYEELIKTAEYLNPTAQFILSGVTPRADSRSAADIRQLNSFLKKKASDNHGRLQYINNSETINCQHLKPDGVHLTTEGTRILATNIKSAILLALKKQDFPHALARSEHH